MNGPLGGQVGPGAVHVPRDDGSGGTIDESSLDKADTAGRRLAQFALDALDEDAAEVASAPLSYRTAELWAEVDNAGYHTLYLLDVFDRELYFFDPSKPIEGDNIPWLRTRETYLQIGPVATITAPGELHPELFVGGYDG